MHGGVQKMKSATFVVKSTLIKPLPSKFMALIKAHPQGI